MKMELLEDLYKQKLAELYDAEQQGLRLLPRVARAAPSAELRRLFEKHAGETRLQVRRLEELIARRGGGQKKRSRAVSGLAAAARSLLAQQGDAEVLALALLSALQDLEGHEIGSYACAHNFARLLGFHDDLKPLEQSFREEQGMEEKLAAATQALGVEEMESEVELGPSARGAA